MGDLGKIASFRVSRFLLIALLGTVFLLVVYAGLMTVGYYRVHSRKTGVEENLANTEAKLSAAREDRDAARVRLMLLGEPVPKTTSQVKETKIKKTSPVNKKGESVASASPEPQEEKKVPREKQEEEPETTPAAPVEKAAAAPASETELSSEETASEDTATSSSGVRVENFQIWAARSNTSVRYKFKLENVSPRDVTLKGYTFVALKPSAESDEPVRIAPWTPMKDGEPSLIKRGQYFGISRFKYVRGSLPDIVDVTRFETVTVYVYSESGDLLHKEVCEVDAALRSRSAD